MKYLLDKNVLPSNLDKLKGDNNLFVLHEVLEEAGYSELEIANAKRAGVKILKVTKKHLEKLKEIISTHGANFRLIDLYTCKGTADVVLLAFVLAEQEQPETLFPDDYIIITKDRELTEVAKSYKLKCMSEII